MARSPKSKLPKFRFLEEVYDRRDPSRIGRFNRWQHSLGFTFAIVKQIGVAREIRIDSRYITSRRREDTAKRLAAGRQKSRLNRELNREMNRELQRKAKLYGLTIEQYLDAIS